MTWAPVDHLAIGLDISSEMNEPPKPMISENTSSMGIFRPFALRKRSTPSTLSATDSTSMMATLVIRNRTMRFIALRLLGFVM